MSISNFIVPNSRIDVLGIRSSWFQHLHRRVNPIHCYIYPSMLALVPQSRGQQPSASLSVSANEKPYLVEWVYKVKWGYADEFWQIFKKYQIAILNREKNLGYITSYTVYRP